MVTKASVAGTADESVGGSAPMTEDWEPRRNLPGWMPERFA
jgi:hypothetical protein